MKLLKTFSPQRHRDTEKGKSRELQMLSKISAQNSFMQGLWFGFPLCLCVSVVNVLPWRFS
jgi:hypothetical protein